MWFNHKTVIFGASKPRTPGTPAPSGKPRFTADPGREQLADLGLEANGSFATKATIASRILHECRFTGYRGETLA
ncbi:hypothetical protein U0C82_18125 [Fulvimarina sp. 2208YS6-2-32]|uniref:Uncharacterized protein n=1 Tax=Fulvimarina uroteuthidis TaxID=3098149 RepID=A0ABU5I7Y5_9HYPH|nr:hypothetical protein [Fulvimarina sp. 2208YS6-2-32]MDY8111048.1 hypothetical protein [Fulvimarina sp. 2208YS6-2-32]